MIYLPNIVKIKIQVVDQPIHHLPKENDPNCLCVKSRCSYNLSGGTSSKELTRDELNYKISFEKSK